MSVEPTAQELEDYEQWCKEEEDKFRRELRRDDPVYERFNCVEFVSTSRGWRYSRKRGRYQRRCYREVLLVTDSYKRRTFSWHKYPFDEVAPEVYEGHGVCDDEAEERLREEIYKMVRE